MSTSFSPEEIIQANKLRSLSQRELQQDLQQHEKLGIYFQNDGLSAVMMNYKRYKQIMDRISELEDLVEDLELERLYAGRTALSRSEWIEKPEGMPMMEFYITSQDKSGE